MSIEEKVFYAVEKNKEQMIDFLQRLIRFNSAVIDHGLDGREGPLQEWLAKQLKDMELEVDVFEPDNEEIKKYKGYSEGQNFKNRPNVVGVLRGKGGGKSLSPKHLIIKGLEQNY